MNPYGADTMMKAYEYSDCYLNNWTQIGDPWPYNVHEQDRPVNGQVAIGGLGKMLAFEEHADDAEQDPRSASCLLELQDQYPDGFSWPNPENGCTYETLSAVAVGGAAGRQTFGLCPETGRARGATGGFVATGTRQC